MVYQLNESEFDKVRALVQPLDFQPFCTAVVAGIHPGRVFVDEPTDPQTVFVSRDDPWCFLAGNPDNDAFNRALNRAIWSRQSVSEDAGALLLTCHPQDWGRHVATLLAPRVPISTLRRRYVCREMQYDWSSRLPEGVVVQRMDETLLERPDLQVPDQVRETLEKWRAIADERFQDVGFVAIIGDEIVSWATVDAVVDGVGDVGFVTLPDYRRRGLATATAAATMEYALSHGVRAIQWTCAETNAGSIRTAEKLGLERRTDYTLYYMVFDEAQHLGTQAYYCLLDRRYQEAIALFEQVFALDGDAPSYVYHDAAQAWAGLGQRGKAFVYLNLAADHGWSAVGATEDCSEFKPWRGTPEWAAVLDRFRQNAEK